MIIYKKSPSNGRFFGFSVIKNKGGNNMYDGIYIKSHQAVSELQRRKKNKTLDGMIEKWFCENHLPEGFVNLTKHNVVGVLARHVPSYKYEDIKFIEIANKLGIIPYWISYRKDTFTTRNPDKNSLWKLSVPNGKGLRNIKLLKRPDRYERFSLDQIVLRNGEKLVDFHKRIRKFFIPDLCENIVECSPWLGKFKNSREYYKYYLALFIKHAILFEEFHPQGSNKDEDKFRMQVVEPAIVKIEEFFGLKPLIVRIPWIGNELNTYPKEIEELIHY